MGQDFKWVSIDKMESEEYGCKYGETVYDPHKEVMLRLLVPPSPMKVQTWDERFMRRHGFKDPGLWAGTRILFLGDYSDTMPPNSVSDPDHDVLAEMPSQQNESDRDSEDEEEDGYRESEFAYLVYRRSRSVERVYIHWDAICEDSFWVLCNLNKKLYARSNGIPTFDESGLMCYRNKMFDVAPHLGQVLLARCTWSSVAWCSMDYEGELNLTQGDWAGVRFDIRAFEEVAEELHQEGWEDVTRAVARQIYDIYESDFGDSIGDFLEEPNFDSEDEDL